MPLNCSADGAFSVLRFQQSIELIETAILPSKLLTVIGLVEAASTLILAAEQGREFVAGFALSASFAGSHPVLNALVLYTMDPGTNQLSANGGEAPTCLSGDCAGRKATLKQGHDRMHVRYLKWKQ